VSPEGGDVIRFHRECSFLPAGSTQPDGYFGRLRRRAKGRNTVKTARGRVIASLDIAAVAWANWRAIARPAGPPASRLRELSAR